MSASTIRLQGSETANPVMSRTWMAAARRRLADGSRHGDPAKSPISPSASGLQFLEQLRLDARLLLVVETQRVGGARREDVLDHLRPHDALIQEVADVAMQQVAYLRLRRRGARPPACPGRVDRRPSPAAPRARAPWQSSPRRSATTRSRRGAERPWSIAALPTRGADAPCAGLHRVDVRDGGAAAGLDHSGDLRAEALGTRRRLMP